MSISTEQAAAALRDIENTEAHSRALRTYQIGSPYLLLWGVIWVVGYTALGFTPDYAWAIWPVLLVLGNFANVILRRREMNEYSPTVRERAQAMARRTIGGYGVLALFWFGVYAILSPHTLNQYCAFPAILMGAIYAGTGVWTALPRYIWLGVIISVLTLAGYFYLAPWFTFWMAAVGGGGLILGGLWLRKA